MNMQQLFSLMRALRKKAQLGASKYAIIIQTASGVNKHRKRNKSLCCLLKVINFLF